MRRPVPDPAALITAVAGRLDGVERDLATLRKDVTAMGRGVSDIVAQMRRLTSAGTRNSTNQDGDHRDAAATGHASGAGPQSDEDDQAGEPGSDDQEAEGQRDWLTVADPGLAHEWLVEAAGWSGWVLACHGEDLTTTPCWPLHPVVVVDLLALSTQREHAYAQDEPTAVCEWLTRWLPAGTDRIRAELDECRRERGHRHDRHLYGAAGLLGPAGLADVATWWTTQRHLTSGPAHLRLPRCD